MAAKIQLTIDANFKSAEDQIKSLGDLTEREAKAMNKAMKKLVPDEINKLSRSTTLLGAGVTAVSGKLAGLTAQKRKLENSVKGLVSKGVSPLSKEMSVLKNRLDSVNKEIKKETELVNKNTLAKKRSEETTKKLGGSIKYVAVAMAGLGALAVKNTISMAEYGDELAKTSRRLGLTVEELQEFAFASERQGVSQQGFITAMEKLQRNIGDARANTGKLQQVLKYTNPELLTMFKNTKTMGEAFELATSSMAGMSDQFDRASLATSLFGRQGLKMLTVTEAGVEGFNSLRVALRNIGVVTSEQAKNSEILVDKMTDLSIAWKIARFQLSDYLAPALSFVTTRLTILLSDIPRLKRVFKEWSFVLKGVIASVTTLSILLGAKMVKSFLTLVKSFRIAFTGLSGIILAVGLLATAFYKAKKDADMWRALVLWGVAQVKYFWGAMTTGISVTWNKFVTEAEELFLDFIWEVGKAAFDGALAVAKMMGVGQAAVIKLNSAYEDFNHATLAWRVKLFEQKEKDNEETKKSIDLVETEYEKEEKLYKKRIKRWGERKSDEKFQHKLNLERTKEQSEALLKSLDEEAKRRKKIREEKEKERQLAESQKQLKDFKEAQLANFFGYEKDEKEFKIFMETLKIYKKEQEDYEKGEAQRRVDAFKAENEAKLALEKQLVDKKIEIAKGYSEAKNLLSEQELRNSLHNIDVQNKAIDIIKRGITDTITLVDSYGKKSRAATILSRALAGTQAIIAGLVGFNQALADPTPLPTWLRLANAFSLLGSSGIAVAKIASTPIPSAETGGRFVVPPSNGVDNVGMKVNPGEVVDVYPMGKQPAGGGVQKIEFSINEDVIFDLVTNGIRQGKIVVDGNL